MDVDAPNTLKRCSSAPLINEAASTAATSPSTNTAPRNTTFFSMFSNNNTVSRTRRFSSGSFSPLSSHTPQVNTTNSWGLRMGRVNQLRAEESLDGSMTREVAHEREVHCAMQMGQSCEDLTLAGLTSSSASSPTRIPRFSPVVSPSPTRKYTTRRSLSPIAIRPSSFSPVSRPHVVVGKRRCDEGETPLPKRVCTSERGGGGGGGVGDAPDTQDSDSLECTFRPVSPRPPRAHRPPRPPRAHDNHNSPNPS